MDSPEKRTMAEAMSSALGTKLTVLSKETGQISRMATIPHKIQRIHFGAFLRSSRKAITASISQLAAMLIFNTFENTPPILTPPVCRQ